MIRPILIVILVCTKNLYFSVKIAVLELQFYKCMKYFVFQMTEQKKSDKFHINVRAKSPVVMSNKSKIAFTDVKSNKNINDMNENSKVTTMKKLYFQYK